MRSLHGKHSVVNGGIYTLWKPREFSPASVILEMEGCSVGHRLPAFKVTTESFGFIPPPLLLNQCLPCMQIPVSVRHSAFPFTDLPLITCTFLHQMPATSAAGMQRNGSLWLLNREQSEKWNFIHTYITYISLVTERKCINNKTGFSICSLPPQNILQSTFIISKQESIT